MAQHDYIISNQTFPNTRADINNLAEAIATNNSGTSAPTTQYAGQFWIDTTTTTWTLYIHDGTDDIQFATIDTSANTVNFTDSALDVVTDTTPQLGGDLDLNSNDITGTGNINITGTATVSGDLTVDTDTLKVDSTNNRVGVGTSSPSSLLELSNSSGNTTMQMTSVDGGNTTIQFGDVSDGSRGTIQYNNTSEYLRFTVNNLSEAMRIDSSGNLLIKTTDIGFSGFGDTLTIGSASGNNGMTIRSGTTNYSTIYFSDATGTGSGTYAGKIQYYHSDNSLRFDTNSSGSERMRIDSSGNVLVGTTDESLYNNNAGTSADNGISLRGSIGKIEVARYNSVPFEANRTGSDGDILSLRKDGATVGSIGVKSTDNLYIADSNNAGITFIGTGVSPVDSTGTGNPNALDLGDSYNTWKDLYLAGNIYLGGTGSANALDDYEEGTWTPSIGGTATYSSQVGTYQKVGNTVFVRFALTVTTRGTGSQAIISGLPFSMGAVEHPFYVGYFGSLQNNVVEFQMRGYQTSIYSSWLLSAGNSVSVNPSYIQDGTSILASGVYKVS